MTHKLALPASFVSLRCLRLRQFKAVGKPGSSLCMSSTGHTRAPYPQQLIPVGDQQCPVHTAQHVARRANTTDARCALSFATTSFSSGLAALLLAHQGGRYSKLQKHRDLTGRSSITRQLPAYKTGAAAFFLKVARQTCNNRSTVRNVYKINSTLKSFTLVFVGPVTTRSPKRSK